MKKPNAIKTYYKNIYRITVLNLVIFYTFSSYVVVYYCGIHLKGNYCVHLKGKYQVKFMGQYMRELPEEKRVMKSYVASPRPYFINKGMMARVGHAREWTCGTILKKMLLVYPWLQKKGGLTKVRW